MLFDTLRLSKDLQESFSPQQAETLARVLGQAGDDQLATKADIATLKADIAAVRTEMAALAADLRGEIASLETRLVKEISLLRADTIRWIVTAIGFNFLATAGLIIGMVKVFAK